MVVVEKRPKRHRPAEENTNQLPHGVHVTTEREGQALFDREARRLLGISGEEFLCRWDAGDYRQPDDTADGHNVARLVMLLPFVRRTSF